MRAVGWLQSLGGRIRGWLPREPVASGPREAEQLSNPNTTVIRVLLSVGLVLGAWGVLAMIYGRQYFEAIALILYFGFILILVLHNERSAEITMERKEA
jgi:hypothetical protein